MGITRGFATSKMKLALVTLGLLLWSLDVRSLPYEVEDQQSGGQDVEGGTMVANKHDNKHDLEYHGHKHDHEHHGHKHDHEHHGHKHDHKGEHGKSCEGVKPYDKLIGIKSWCETNCNHVPPYCPSSHCKCH